MLFKLFIIFFLLVTNCNAQILDKIVASVNREAILDSELQARIKFLKKNGGSSISKEQALDQLVDEKLLEQEARTLGISTNDSEVEKYATLLSSDNNLTVSQFYAKNAQSGIPKEQLNQQLKTQILQQKMVGKLFQSEAKITKEEIAGFKKQNPSFGKVAKSLTLQMLLLSKNRKNFTADLNNIKKQVVAKADFTTLVKKYSSDPSAKNNGNMGTLSVADLNPAIKSAVQDTPAGQVASPLETSNGIYIFKVLRRTDGKSVDTKQSNAQIKNILQRKKLQTLFSDYMKNKINDKHIVERKL